MFNIWTACESLAGMIGILENKNNMVDVLILDRGIFDATCWFHWLVSRKNMEEEQRKNIEAFILQEELVKRIDIVFAFITKPQVSIEREYATLLTKKNGTIMNRKVLHEYCQSVKHVVKEKENKFHKIFMIDTSTKNQDEVGKEVTNLALGTLRDLLVEKVGVIKRTSEINRLLDQGGIIDFEMFNRKVKNKVIFMDRTEVEDLDEYIQPIPIAVIVSNEQDKVLVIRKTSKSVSKNSPEKDKDLVYVGGHPRYEDSINERISDFENICKSALKREVKEEIGITLALSGVDPFIIYTPDSDKSRRHFAVCYVVQQDTDTVFNLDSNELVQKKGVTRSGKFCPISKLDYSNLEQWSKNIIQHVFGIEIQEVYQMSMFEV